jgi:hypothetical protein
MRVTMVSPWAASPASHERREAAVGRHDGAPLSFLRPLTVATLPSTRMSAPRRASSARG